MNLQSHSNYVKWQIQEGYIIIILPYWAGGGVELAASWFLPPTVSLGLRIYFWYFGLVLHGKVEKISYFMLAFWVTSKADLAQNDQRHLKLIWNTVLDAKKTSVCMKNYMCDIWQQASMFNKCFPFMETFFVDEKLWKNFHEKEKRGVVAFHIIN